ncbi:MAG: hypothetical protein ACKO5K_07435, partial [Armatimonadota bacterium]
QKCKEYKAAIQVLDILSIDGLTVRGQRSWETDAEYLVRKQKERDDIAEAKRLRAEYEAKLWEEGCTQ